MCIRDRCLLLLLVGALMLFDVKMKMLYILFSGHCIASVLFPGWFFQGIQERKYVTYFQDVYKRQVFPRSVHSFSGLCIFGVIHAVDVLHGPAPVSYTHLDVYKRQPPLALSPESHHELRNLPRPIRCTATGCRCV